MADGRKQISSLPKESPPLSTSKESFTCPLRVTVPQEHQESPENAAAVAGLSDIPPVLTSDQLRRWAKLIASGEDAFPANLPEPDRARLAEEVRRLMRARLISVVAQAIAQDMRLGSTAMRNQSQPASGHDSATGALANTRANKHQTGRSDND